MGTKLIPSKYDAYHKALDDEPYFTFLARDKYAPEMLRRWANLIETEIVNLERPPFDIEQVREARRIADDMDAWLNDPVNLKRLGKIEGKPLPL